MTCLHSPPHHTMACLHSLSLFHDDLSLFKIGGILYPPPLHSMHPPLTPLPPPSPPPPSPFLPPCWSLASHPPPPTHTSPPFLSCCRTIRIWHDGKCTQVRHTHTPHAPPPHTHARTRTHTRTHVRTHARTHTRTHAGRQAGRQAHTLQSQFSHTHHRPDCLARPPSLPTCPHPRCPIPPICPLLPTHTCAPPARCWRATRPLCCP